MEFMLSIHGENCIVDELWNDLNDHGATIYTSKGCLCSYNINSLKASLPQVIIYHPLRKQYGSSSEVKTCLEKMKSNMELNPQSLFYIFCRGAPERKDFFNKLDNIRFIDDDNTLTIWNEILELIDK
ncbi:MAG: hypothetical protein WC781_01675 [Candidatus Pacearchaeota archaeon]|jgi:hypothetical protein